MPKICYVRKQFTAEHSSVIDAANEIIEEYLDDGFDLTLRQLYYQFVSRGLIANVQTEYKRLGGIIKDARLAGRVDWSAIVDRTRNVERRSHWKRPRDIIHDAARGFNVDRWTTQKGRVEVWVEKDALSGVIEPACRDFDVPFFSCRGYLSRTEMWAGAMRFVRHAENGQAGTIVHLGDHDPSGLDMTRDIRDSITLFFKKHSDEPAPRIMRIALNMDQVREYGPPPNPAKVTDSRIAGYMDEHGSDSWELDALEPRVLDALVRQTLAGRLDDRSEYDERVDEETGGRRKLQRASDRWDDVEAMLERGRWNERR